MYYSRSAHQPLQLGAKLGSGGEATVHTVQGSNTQVAKIYHQPTSVHAAKLLAMVASRPSDPMQGTAHVSFAWPSDLIDDDHGRGVGFLMPAIDTVANQPLLKFYHPKDRLQTAPSFTWQYLLRIARNVAGVVAAVQAAGYVVGDLNESNLLVSTAALATLVDCDSMQVPAPNGGVYRCLVGKGEYTPPELQGQPFQDVDRRPDHDYFGLAVLLFLLLMEGNHPFAGVWTGSGNPMAPEHIRARRYAYAGNPALRPPPLAPSFTMLPPPVQTLFVRCFGVGLQTPGLRPSPPEWQEALAAAERRLAVCVRNSQHRYSDHLGAACPWCIREARGISDPFPQPRRQEALPAIPFTLPLSGSQRQTAPIRPVAAPPSAPAVPQQVVKAIPAAAKSRPATQPPQSGSSRPNAVRRSILLGLGVSGLMSVAKLGWTALTWGPSTDAATSTASVATGALGNIATATTSADRSPVPAVMSSATSTQRVVGIVAGTPEIANSADDEPKTESSTSSMDTQPRTATVVPAPVTTNTVISETKAEPARLTETDPTSSTASVSNISISHSTNNARRVIHVVSAPHAIAVNAVTNRIYLASWDDDTITVLDGATYQILARVLVGNLPQKIAVNLANNRIYVASLGDGAITVLDGGTNKILTTIPATGSSDIAANPVTNRIYITNSINSTISILDGATSRFLAKVDVGGLPEKVALNPTINQIYVVSFGGETIVVLDGATNRILSPIRVDGQQHEIAVNAKTDRVYVTDFNADGAVSAFDGATHESLATVHVGGLPSAIAINATINRIYVVSSVDNTVSVIDGGTNRILSLIDSSSLQQFFMPQLIAVNSKTDRIYIIGSNGDMASIPGTV